jgi:hypothetical protein
MAKYKLYSITNTRLQVRTRKALKNRHWDDTNQKKVDQLLIPSPDKYKTRRYILKGKYLKWRFGISWALCKGVNRVQVSQKER